MRNEQIYSAVKTACRNVEEMLRYQLHKNAYYKGRYATPCEDTSVRAQSSYREVCALVILKCESISSSKGSPVLGHADALHYSLPSVQFQEPWASDRQRSSIAAAAGERTHSRPAKRSTALSTSRSAATSHRSSPVRSPGCRTCLFSEAVRPKCFPQMSPTAAILNELNIE